jgi:hypothetical protein
VRRLRAQGKRLRAQDKELLIDLAWEDALPADPVEVTHFFSFPFNQEGARAANAELEDSGFKTWLVAEDEDDDYLHIAAVKVQSLRPAVVAEERVRMESLADRHRGRYDDWDLTKGAGRRGGGAWQIRSLLRELRASSRESD